jgi:hypothetical protein
LWLEGRIHSTQFHSLLMPVSFLSALLLHLLFS